jgi:hypothetical protein
VSRLPIRVRLTAAFAFAMVLVAASTARACSTTSSRVTSPSCRPSVKAKPALVVASASNPSAPNTFAEPASHGFGMTNGDPS